LFRRRQLMNELAPLLGRDLCMNFVALELAAFADDSTFRVRKVIIRLHPNCGNAQACLTRRQPRKVLATFVAPSVNRLPSPSWYSH
jgi:hypothetical protein